MNRIRTIIVAAALSAALVASCGVDTKVIGVVPDASAPAAFGEEDSGAVTPEAGLTLTEYCPSNKCPAGHTTCPSSRFACDVNVLTDRQNCGACGVVCQGNGEEYECVDGQCEILCGPETLDCDGFPDNGCEAPISSNDSCGGCGNKCLDPDRPCMLPGTLGGQYGCGCPNDDLRCSGFCIDPKTHDLNCGQCGNTCDPTGGGRDVPPNMYYGCVAGECGAGTVGQPLPPDGGAPSGGPDVMKYLKCKSGYADCDGDLDNGCEALLTTTANCGSCGNACDPGNDCRLDPRQGQPFQCMCPTGRALCGARCTVDPFSGNETCIGSCHDLKSDRENCGACGNVCQSPTDTAVAMCVNGICTQGCVSGRADCNGNTADGCEVNSDSDPRNCGGCGRVCDAIAGQACVGGRCVVEPCDQVDAGAGGPK